jgi:hypothetical protein
LVTLDEAWLRRRHESYLSANYITLHNTVVSVTLAVAGLAAGNLIVLPTEFAGYELMLRLLWLVSLLATLTAFAGAAVGAGTLPPRIPSILDLLAPLLLGVSECLMFGILARQAQSIVAPQAVMQAWYFALAIFGVSAAVSILRARQIILSGPYTLDVVDKINRYARGLKYDAAAAGCVALVGIIGCVWYSLGGANIHPIGNIVLVGLVMLGLSAGLRSHSVARKGLQV